MKIAFVRPAYYSKWGGDLKALNDLQEGLKAFGHDAFITTELPTALSADQILFSGTGADHTPNLHAMQLAQREYGCIAFHEDHLLFSGASFGFFYYIASILEGREEYGHLFSLEALFERPHLIYYFDRVRPIHSLVNYDFFKRATAIIANSHTEERTLLRDFPGSRPKVVYWAAGLAGALQERPTSAFLPFVNLQSGSYILQVGRLSPRKNQLATLLATKDLDIPLVFIAMDDCSPAYEPLFLAAAARWRRAPTILISQHLDASYSHGSLRVIPTPQGEILSKELMLSAFAHTGLHLHPAFYELPGYTYLESSRLGIPTIATEWSSLKDYFTDFSTGQYRLDDRIEYALPYDIPALRQLVEKKFGKKTPELPLDPIFQRRPEDVARDFLNALEIEAVAKPLLRRGFEK